MTKNFKLLTMLTVLLLIISFSLSTSVAAAEKTPEELKAIAENALNIAVNCAKQLDGEWGGQHAALIESGKGKDFSDFENMRGVLSKFLEGSDATYIYVIYPSGEIDSAPFFTTVEGGSNADDYGTEHKWEAGFAAAWKGTPTAADETWKDDDGSLMLSAYAPVHDGKGNVVAILGVDCKVQ
jgi:hypothetical protein